MLETVNMEDVYPDENNPRRDFGDIAALADTFELNGGYPTNPIVVVRDGGIYRIVDGERRYRAMKMLGKAACPAVVYDSMEDASAAAAMVATDDKQPLTAEEKSRGVQQMLLLGIDPAKVEKAARLRKGQGARLAKARRMVDDAGDDMTIDRLLAISEFEPGDPAVAELESCSEKEWRGVYGRIVRDREMDAEAAALIEAAAGAGIPVVGRAPEGFEYQAATADPERLAVIACEGCVCVVSKGWRAEAAVYAPADPDADAKRAEERMALDELNAAVEVGEKRRRAFFAEGGAQAVAAMVAEEWISQNGYLLDSFYDGLDVEEPDRVLYGLTPLAVAYQSCSCLVGELEDCMWRMPNVSEAAGFLAWLAAFERDGYQADAADELCRAACRRIIEEEE